MRNLPQFAKFTTISKQIPLFYFELWTPLGGFLLQYSTIQILMKFASYYLINFKGYQSG